MNKLDEIIIKYKEFNQYLHNVDIEELNTYSRKELMELHDSIYKIEPAFVQTEIYKLIQKKKIEEYPQLLGVHHYPDISSIDFLAEEAKVKLDKYLATLGKGAWIHTQSVGWQNLLKTIGNENGYKTLYQLNELGITTINYLAIWCCDNRFYIMQSQLDDYRRYFELDDMRRMSDTECAEYDALRRQLCLYFNCDDCDKETAITLKIIDSAIENTASHEFKIIKERDKSLDNV